MSRMERIARLATSVVSTITAECVVFSCPKVAAVMSDKETVFFNMYSIFSCHTGRLLTVLTDAPEEGPRAVTMECVPEVSAFTIRVAGIRFALFGAWTTVSYIR